MDKIKVTYEMSPETANNAAVRAGAKFGTAEFDSAVQGILRRSRHSQIVRSGSAQTALEMQRHGYLIVGLEIVS